VDVAAAASCCYRPDHGRAFPSRKHLPSQMAPGKAGPCSVVRCCSAAFVRLLGESGSVLDFVE
jgi:hypothetical protein